MEDNFDKCVQNALKVIRELKLEKFIRDFDDDTHGFMWSRDDRIDLIGQELMLDGHSGASFAFTLRMCQSILKKEEEEKRNSKN